MNRWRVIRTANLLHYEVADRNRVRARDTQGNPMKWKDHSTAQAYADRLNKERRNGGEP